MNPDTDGATPKTLRLCDVAKRYGQGAYVLEGLSYAFGPGQATGLVGPNGSGKTTLLRLLSATSYPTSGHVRWGDLDAHEHPHRYLRDVGVVYDAADLPQYLTAVELLEYVLRARGRWEAGAPERIGALLGRLRLDERRANLIGTYSSGMFKKTQIAAGLIHRPPILLLDEPFRGLDEESLTAALHELQAFKRGGGILIIASHRRDLLDALCDDVIRLPLGGSVGSVGGLGSSGRGEGKEEWKKGGGGEEERGRGGEG